MEIKLNGAKTFEKEMMKPNLNSNVRILTLENYSHQNRQTYNRRHSHHHHSQLHSYHHLNQLKRTNSIKRKESTSSDNYPLLVESLNELVFYLFVLFIILLNISCLYIFPYLIKTPLKINE